MRRRLFVVPLGGAFVFARQRTTKAKKAFVPDAHVFLRRQPSVTGFCNSQYHIPTRSGTRQTRTRHGAHSGGAVARPRVPERDLAAHRASRPGDGASRPPRVRRSRPARSSRRHPALNRHFLGSRGIAAGPPRVHRASLGGREGRAGSPWGTSRRVRPPPTAPDRPRPRPGRHASPLGRAVLTSPPSPLPPRRLRPRRRARASRPPGR
jgi:hypothetical protein